MNFNVNFWFIVTFTIVHQTFQISSEVLKVSIYYESLCLDSIKFILEQLHPAYKKIGQNLKIDYVPYGKATQHQRCGKWYFDCHHGPAECRGNKLQACALAANKPEAKNVEFVSCVMDFYDPSSNDAIANCASILGLTSAYIIECTDNIKGNEILAKYGNRTHALRPKISFVPTIIFNNVYSEKIQDGSLTDFLSTACNQFHTKPTACYSTANTLE